jgi:SAM-dependent methyltransferase
MNDAAAYFATRFTFHPRRQAVWREITAYIERDLPDRTSLLELGCGYGDFINQVHVQRKLALDQNEGVRARLAPDVHFVCGDCTNLGFLAPASVATVMASNLLEHLDRDQLERLMAEITRVLRPGGRLILLQPNYRLCAARYFDDYTHVSVFSDASLCGFLTAHAFTIVRCVAGLLPFSMGGRLPKHPLLVRLYLRSPVRPLAAQMYVVAQKP